MIYAALHDKDNTFLWMNRAVDERATAVGSISREPLLDFLRTDSRYAELIKRIGLYQGPLQPTTTSN